MIELSDIHFQYPSGRDVLSAVSVSIQQGELVGLVGANGSGKSTLMALVAGLYTPRSGSAVVDGFTSPGDEKKIRRACRMVMQDADLQILGATVEEDMLMGRKRGEDDRSKARAMADRLNLGYVWSQPVTTLSWGMKRKLCLAAALLDEPKVLLLDEPFSGLDYPGIREMRALLGESKHNGLTQIVSSHDLECFVDLVDTLVVLEHGRLVLAGSPEEVLGKVKEHGVRPPCSWRAGLGVQSYDGDE